MSPTETRPLLGCIADDFTGATDLANMLVRGGMRTVQVIGVPAADAELEAADAVVVALKSRTTPAAEAVSESLAALAWLRQRGCRQFFFKYCSTFDSTAEGNIGPVAEALQEALDCDFTLACPAFPETGRTLFRGHLFVQDQLLSESGMQHHPLTPMSDANLVRVLQAQSRGKVGLLRYDQVAQGPEAVRQAIARLRESGHRLAIADALSDADLHTLGAACAELPLVTGGSGIAQGLPENFRRAGLLDKHDAAALDLPVGGEAVLAGSASQATNGQVAAWLEAGRPALRLDPLALAQGDESIDTALAWAREQGQAVLIYATSPADEVKAIQRELGVARAGELVERALGLIARGLFDSGVRRLVVAGGETSGAVVQALGVQALRIGAQIDPGVPATLGQVQGEPLALALKSGNFGSRDFFAKALRQLAGEQP
ncbi:four-carbon acid sugar kinase family protein [Pseudomonas oryzihabitans]|uniref:3-oxo-tetronate kinase n=1 Tax=Pseudomonas oryzihabitans TaxID=47885 RepID=UPI001473B058|nr:3-oxo-tetronate kinase [Pseudomonas oryzihabitans]NMZ62830.1 four-carbon acid sugar kinase family protein [Pseudomonas oryzihabitans]